MRSPQKISTGQLLQVLLVLALLCIILNPELRALIFFVDAIGLEITFLLVMLQARMLGATIVTSARPLAVTMCEAAFHIGRAAIATYPAKVNSSKLHRVLCPTLIGLSYGVRCNAAHPSSC